ncbi:hypothetical protein HY745_09640 [Candidatus Desantisbacteria bacterium]|nr:hypothetical protein [Candidatus Desantisbacteria bacterium]
MKARNMYLIAIFLFCCFCAGNVFGEDIDLSEIYSISPGLIPVSYSKVKEKKSNNFSSHAKCGTSDFKELYLNFNKLSKAARSKTIRKFFRRPTEFSEESDDFQFDKSETVLDYEIINGNFRVHYTKTKSSRNNLVPLTDNNSNNVPDYVEKCASIFESVWVHEIDELGYKKPESDAGLGGNNKYDIYLLNLDIRKWFGYTQPEGNINDSKKTTYPSFIVIDNDFPFNVYGFSDPLDALRITAAHEFFHAIQNSYDWLEEIWWCEASSVWMEEETYPDINGYLVFLKDFFNYPWIALDRNRSIVNPGPNHHYAAGIFPIFLTDYFKDVNVIKYIWEECAMKDTNKIQATEAIKRALRARYAADMRDVFPFFTIYNYFTGINHNKFLHQGKYYYDGAYYPEIAAIYDYYAYPINNSFPPYLKKPYNWGANYIIFNSENLDSNLEIVFQSDGTNSSENVWRVN